MTREQLIKAIDDNQERWSCPNICKSIEIGCMECAEKQLAEYEEGIRAELYDEVRDEVEQGLSSVLDGEKRISEAEAIDKFVKIFKAKTTMEHKLVDDIAEQLKEQIWNT